jgi:hypothetical protein
MNCLWCFSDDKRELNLNEFDTSSAVFRDLRKSNAPILVFTKCSNIRRLIHSEIHNQFSPLGSSLAFILPPRKWFFVDLSLYMLFICVSHHNAADEKMSSFSRSKRMIAARTFPHLPNHRLILVENSLTSQSQLGHRPITIRWQYNPAPIISGWFSRRQWPTIKETSRLCLTRNSHHTTKVVRSGGTTDWIYWSCGKSIIIQESE